MCSICGVYNRNAGVVSIEDLKKMTHIQNYRGPDDEGYYQEGSIGFGHGRLSIIDLTQAGHQPMSNEDDSLWIVYNGEIYNYLELREELKGQGHRFKSSCDTEVILHAYEEWGLKCVERFNGMWAFGLWDANKKKLFLSRDRFGIKPLYYVLDNDSIIFASEIKAILSIRDDLRKPNLPYLRYFLETSVLDDGSETFFEKIKSLEGAHCLEVWNDGYKLWRYWDYDLLKTRKKYDYSNPVKTLLELLTDSVRLRLRSDVPVGTCLSGGLDSSTIVALTTKLRGSSVCTFTSIYEDLDCNEEMYAREVAEMYRTNTYFTNPKGEDLFKILPRIVWHMDEPTAGPGLFSQWHVMDVASNKVKVLLDGQGGDELLGGYFYYYPQYMSDLSQKFKDTKNPMYIIRYVINSRDIKYLTGNLYSWPSIVQEIPYVSHIRKKRKKESLSLKTSLQQSLFTESFNNEVKPVVRNFPKRFNSKLQNTLYWSLTKYSIPALLHYEDRNSMAFSIEARVPFLDYRVVEFCLGLPPDMKIRGSITKYILRKAAKKLLPNNIIKRRDKKGYPTPCNRWFREQMDIVETILYSDSSRKRNILNLDIIKERLVAHKNNKIDCSWEIWRWIITELWFREFIDGFSLDGGKVC